MLTSTKWHCGIVGDEKAFQLFPLKCSTGLMFSEKNVVFIVQSGVKLYDFTIVAASVETNANHKT